MKTKATERVTALRDRRRRHEEKHFIPARVAVSSQPFRRKNAGMTGLNWTPAPGRNGLNITTC